MAQYSVAIIGGGVAGMSAAHELMQRNRKPIDYDIQIYEANAVLCGGKARSIPVPDSGTDGREDLPGEHGFRFFPGFYRHLPDTMKSIPYRNHSNVWHNLTKADQMAIPRFDKPPIDIVARFPKSLQEIVEDLKAMFLDDTGLTSKEVEFFGERLWQILTSCHERRLACYEGKTWREFLKADEFNSEPYTQLLVDGLSRSLLANDPRLASTRTTGDTNIQLILGITDPFRTQTDRLLNGPTSKVWLDPWLDFLTTNHVGYHFDQKATEITFAGGQVASVTLSGPDGTQDIEADYYIFALPVEKLATLLAASPTSKNSDGKSLVQAFDNIAELSKNVRWMNGVQFYLYEDVKIVKGHMLFAESPWAITGISEAQFWCQEILNQTGDGTVNGVLSFCISEWDTEGRFNGKKARECTREELAEEVWAEVKCAVNSGGQELLKDSNRHSWFLDPDIKDNDEVGHIEIEDTEPLFINVVNSWEKRPEVEIGIPNMFLASDYVRTYTDVACMEAANEAARRAVNALLAVTGSAANPCELWRLHEPAIFAPYRWHDEHRFKQGKDWDGKLLF